MKHQKLPGDEPLKNTFEHIWQPEKGLATSSKHILLFNNFRREKPGWKTKIKFDSLRILFQNILFQKEFFECLILFLPIYKKINSDLKLVYGAHFLLIFTSKSSSFNR